MTPQPAFPSSLPPPDLSQFNPPAIGLIVAGATSLLVGLMQLGSGVLSVVMGARNPALENPELPPALAPLVKMMSSGAISILWALVVLTVGVVTVLGGLRFREGRSYWLCVAGAGLASVPCCFHSCCSVFAMPLGIWALAVLLSGSTKSMFRD